MMRLGLGLAVLAIGLLPGCTGNEVTDVAARLGCGPVDGLGAITSVQPPTYILVGELGETNEGPAAFAELACHLAARQVKDMPLWVGLSEYAGGSTEAERALRARLDDLVSKGAPLVVGSILEGHPTSARDRDLAESYWASTIMANVKSVDAGRALLLMPRVDGLAEAVRTTSERYSNYDPMALYLPAGRVLNLELGQANGIDAPTIRIYTQMTDGYMGQIALGSITPATVTGDAAEAPPMVRPVSTDLTQDMIRYVAESGLVREKQVDILARYLESRMNADRRMRIEARRQMTANRVDKARIDDIVPDPFSEAPVTEFPALARSKATEELAAWEKRKAEGVPPPFGNPVRSRLPQDLRNLVEKELGYVPN